jgi:hypothetical protein
VQREVWGWIDLRKGRGGTFPLLSFLRRRGGHAEPLFPQSRSRPRHSPAPLRSAPIFSRIAAIRGASKDHFAAGFRISFSVARNTRYDSCAAYHRLSRTRDTGCPSSCLDPLPRRTGPIRRAEPFRYDALQADLADLPKHQLALGIGVLVECGPALPRRGAPTIDPLFAARYTTTAPRQASRRTPCGRLTVRRLVKLSFRAPVPRDGRVARTSRLTVGKDGVKPNPYLPWPAHTDRIGTLCADHFNLPTRIARIHVVQNLSGLQHDVPLRLSSRITISRHVLLAALKAWSKLNAVSARSSPRGFSYLWLAAIWLRIGHGHPDSSKNGY